MATSPNDQRRYYIHWRLRKLNNPSIDVKGSKKTINTTQVSIDELAPTYRNYIKELIEKGYSIQLTIN